MNFIEKSANRECPGGLYGCAVNGDSDMRCRAGAKYFLNKNALIDQAIRRQLSYITVMFVFILVIIQSN